MKIFYSARFRTSSLSNLVNNLFLKEFTKRKHDDRKCEICGIKFKDCDCCLEYRSVANNLIEWECLCCNMI